MKLIRYKRKLRTSLPYTKSESYVHYAPVKSEGDELSISKLIVEYELHVFKKNLNEKLKKVIDYRKRCIRE